MYKDLLSKINKKRILEIKSKNNSHFLVNGDSLKILKEIPDNVIDLIITDPPYYWIKLWTIL